MWLANCTVIDVEDPASSFQGSLRVEDGTVVETSENAPPAGAEALDLEGRFLIP